MDLSIEPDWRSAAVWIDTVYDLVIARIGCSAGDGLERTYGGVSFSCGALPIGAVAFVLERDGDYRFGFFEWYAHTPEKAASHLLKLYRELGTGSTV